MIVTGLNHYFIKGTEIVESVLDSTDSGLSQTEIDNILSLAEKTPEAEVIHFLLEGSTFIHEKTSELSGDPLNTVQPPTARSKIWPAFLKGIPSSTGFAIGPCVFSLEQAKGKILIASHLNLKDVKSLEGIKGIILENGSLLSHVGVLAREKKIPCIMGVKGVLSIPEGTMIKMDAVLGLISPV